MLKGLYAFLRKVVFCLTEPYHSSVQVQVQVTNEVGDHGRLYMYQGTCT